MTLDGHTRIIAHVGHPTATFRAPLIYNPYFAAIGMNIAVVPMGVRREDGATALPAIFRMSNVMGALVTMPHKIDVVTMLDEVSAAVRIAGACNAVRITPDGRWIGDNVDGAGFVGGLARKGCAVAGARALVVGAGGVGSAIAAALAAGGADTIGLFDVDHTRMDALATRLTAHYPNVTLPVGSRDPAGFTIVVNATPLGMKPGDPLPFDIDRVHPGALVGEVVLTDAPTPLLRAAEAKGCRTQVGLDMLYEMIPAYLSFFGLPTTTPDRLRALSHADRSAS